MIRISIKKTASFVEDKKFNKGILFNFDLLQYYQAADVKNEKILQESCKWDIEGIPGKDCKVMSVSC